MPIPYERPPRFDDVDDVADTGASPDPEDFGDDEELELERAARLDAEDEEEELLFGGVSSAEELDDEFAADEESYDERDASTFGFGNPAD